MNTLKCLCICIFLWACGFINLAQGQSAPQSITPTENELANDPIIELLDSLVMLNNIIRFNSIANNTPGVTSSRDYPNYSDEIYEQRIGKIYSPIPLVYNAEVKKYIELYAYKRRGLTSRVMGLSDLYFPLFEEILDKEGLPLEFKYLSIVESALNPIAVSKMGATGLWQFMYNTGKMYNLKIDSYFDERMDPVKATHAACRYFKDMYNIYGDWLLVIAAYNCGPGNVNKAIRRSGGKTNFWDIAQFLPAETRGYVPAFIAVTYVMNYASEHQIFPVQPAYNYFEVDTLAIDKSVSLKSIATAVDLPLDVIKYLNPLYKRGVIPQTENSNVLRLPSGSIPAFLAAEESLYNAATPGHSIASSSTTFNGLKSTQPDVVNGPYKMESKRVKKIYTIRSGDNLSAIASRLKCSVADLKAWNKLNSNVIATGKQLSYYTTIQVKVPLPVVEPEVVDQVVAKVPIATPDEASAKNEKHVAPANPDFIYHVVEKGDTLWNIAKRYEGATVEQIMEINKITNSGSLVPGTKIKVKISG